MSILGRYRLARDPSVTVANLLDELVRRKGNCEVTVEENGPFFSSTCMPRFAPSTLSFAAPF